jgi:beta-glucanase (GH16 family)
MSWYLPENVEVKGGALHLIARKQAVSGYEGHMFPYTSGMVTSGRNFAEREKPSRFDLTYGYIEIRAKMPSGSGLWPALWLLPSTQQPLPEIDIMEMLGNAPHTLHMHFHFRALDGQAAAPGRSAAVADLSAGWHVYGLKWAPDELVWFLDGAEEWRYRDIATIPSGPMYLLVNLAVGGKWPGPPSNKTVFPAELLVDYVRAWKAAE